MCVCVRERKREREGERECACVCLPSSTVNNFKCWTHYPMWVEFVVFLALLEEKNPR